MTVVLARQPALQSKLRVIGREVVMSEKDGKGVRRREREEREQGGRWKVLTVRKSGQAQKGKAKGGKGKEQGKEDKDKSSSGGKVAGKGRAAGFDFNAETERLVKAFMMQSGGDEGKDLVDNDELVSEVVSCVRADAKAAILEAASSVFSSGAQRRAKRDALQAKFVVLYQQLCLFRKGLGIFSQEQQGTVDKYLLKSVCTDIVNLILADHASEGSAAEAPPITVATAEDRQKVLSQLPSTTQRSLQSLVEALASTKSSEQFVGALEKVASEAGVECKVLDKNVERGAVFATRQQWQEQLKAETNPPIVLVLALQLLTLNLHKVLVSLPG